MADEYTPTTEQVRETYAALCKTDAADEPCKEGHVYLTRSVDGRREVFATSEGTVCVTHGRNWPCTAAKEPCLHDAPAMSQTFRACPPETVPAQP